MSDPPDIPATLGPYRILGQLGHGGMGVVYRAVHRDGGPEVAVKTVAVPHEIPLAAIRREIRALAAIRHEGVVRILDEGVDGGIPWYAMELVDGPSLRDHLDRSTRATTPAHIVATTEDLDGGSRSTSTANGTVTVTAPLTGPLPPPAAPGSPPRGVPPPARLSAEAILDRLGIAVKICTPLAHVHGEGFVHRDLKPENVMLRADGTPVLVDFALALRFGQSRDPVDQDATPAGTIAYMAPEQTEGQLGDARTDLYALGCILYELCTETLPYTGSPQAILSRRRSRRPEPPSHLNPAVGPELDALVLSLLEHSPEDRLGHAADVAAALVRLGAAPDPAARSAVRPYLYRPAFVGREDALAALEPFIDGVAGGAGGTAFLGGASGIGKTRLALEIARRARHRGTAIVACPCVAFDAGRGALGAGLHPFRPLLHAVADRCHAQAGALADLLGDRGKVLAQVEPYLAGIPGFDALPQPEALAPAAARERLLRALHDTLDAFADTPLLVVIDDLQWADELTLLYLKGLRDGDFPAGRAAILGLYRVEEQGPTLRNALGPITSPHHMVLGQLSDRAVGAMAGGMLALVPCPGHLARMLAEHAGGNPFFVAEYLRTVIASGLLQRGPGGEWRLSGAALADETLAALPLPGSLRELILRRIGLLSEEAHAVAQAAAAIGREGDTDLLGAVAGRAELLGSPVFRELLERQVLEEPAPGRFRFLHDKLREIVHQALAPEDRRRLHRAAALAIEAAGVSAPVLGTLAHHWEEAGVDEKAAAYLERAADHLLGTGAYGDAVRMLERALARSTVGAVRRASWERRLAHACLALGQLVKCDRHASAALSLLSRPAPRGSAGWGARLGVEAARQVAHLLLPARLFEEPARRDALVEAALAAGSLARVGFFEAEPLKMVGASLLAVNLAERAGGAAEATRNYAGLGFMVGLIPIRPLAARYFDRARRTGELTRDHPGLVFSLTSEAVYLLGAGRFGAARRVLARAEGLSGKTGDPADVALVQTLLGHADHYEGRFDDAIARYGQIMALARTKKNSQAEAWSLYCTARTLLALGLWERAVQQLTLAQALLAHQRDAMSEVACAGLLAMAYLGAGDEAGAARAAAAAEALLREARPAIFLAAYGHAGVARVRLAELSRAPSRHGPEREAAFAACARLGAVVRTFPVVEPQAALALGRARALTGDRRRAAAAYRRSLASARAMGMPLEEALARAALAEVVAAPEDARHREAARAIFERLGCAHFLQAPPGK